MERWAPVCCHQTACLAGAALSCPPPFRGRGGAGNGRSACCQEARPAPPCMGNHAGHAAQHPPGGHRRACVVVKAQHAAPHQAQQVEGQAAGRRSCQRQTGRADGQRCAAPRCGSKRAQTSTPPPALPAPTCQHPPGHIQRGLLLELQRQRTRGCVQQAEGAEGGQPLVLKAPHSAVEAGRIHLHACKVGEYLCFGTGRPSHSLCSRCKQTPSGPCTKSAAASAACQCCARDGAATLGAGDEDQAQVRRLRFQPGHDGGRLRPWPGQREQ